jgi:two-component system sensor histidine kinase/response regulator
MVARHTILAVDDEPASLRAVERTLAADYLVMSATAAAQGLAVLAAQPVAMMIVDQRMPDMSGTELLARTATQHPEVIRVLLTGYTDIDTLVDAINAGHVYYYLTKPWEPRELRLVVRRGLERYEAAAERRRLQTDLRQACERLRREVERQRRLLTVTAHELGTPLHLLSNALGLMAETALPDAARSWLDTARRSIEWLGRGVAQMARHSRWQMGHLPLRRRPTDLGALLGTVQAVAEPLLHGRHLTLCVTVPRTLPAVLADPLWLECALFNLLSNAIRFTPDGGRIAVAAAARAGMLGLTVADTGVGIEAPLLNEVFEPFSAAGGTLSLHTSGRFEFGSRGLGLGLAITKAIIEQHGGTIAVRSQPGAGSEFTVWLPLQHGETVTERAK